MYIQIITFVKHNSIISILNKLSIVKVKDFVYTLHKQLPHFGAIVILNELYEYRIAKGAL